MRKTLNPYNVISAVLLVNVLFTAFMTQFLNLEGTRTRAFFAQGVHDIPDLSVEQKKELYTLFQEHAETLRHRDKAQTIYLVLSAFALLFAEHLRRRKKKADTACGNAPAASGTRPDGDG